MKRSSSTKILTTHVGSLPRPDGTDRAGGEDDAALREMVKDVVARQRDIGIDVINEGEFTKGGDWLSYVDNRFGGFEARPPAGGTPLILQGKDREEFADFYRYATRARHAVLRARRADQARAAALGRDRADHLSRRRRAQARDRHFPRGGRAGHRGVHHHHRAGEPRALSRATSTTRRRRSSCSRSPRRCATEYQTIVEAGFILQIDDAWLAALWDRIGIADGARGLPQVLRGADRGAEPRAARPAGGPHPLSPVLGQLARPARLRHRAGEARRPDAARCARRAT